MFDVGILEIILIGVIALLIVGPERLPKIAYEVGLWFGRLQRVARHTRMEIERELHNFEIQKNLEEQAGKLDDLNKTANSVVKEVTDFGGRISESPPPVPAPSTEPTETSSHPADKNTTNDE